MSLSQRPLPDNTHTTRNRLQNVSRDMVWLETVDCYVSKIVAVSWMFTWNTGREVHGTTHGLEHHKWGKWETCSGYYVFRSSSDDRSVLRSVIPVVYIIITVYIYKFIISHTHHIQYNAKLHTILYMVCMTDNKLIYIYIYIYIYMLI